MEKFGNQVRLWLITVIFSCLLAVQLTAAAAVTDYNDQSNWAYWRLGDGKQADCFLVCPTVYSGGEEQYNLPPGMKPETFVGALNMERDIYAASCTLYAPYYQQAALAAYKLPPKQAQPYFALAYEDVRAAFQYFLTKTAADRPLVLAGFSQGADMCLRLLQEFGADAGLQKRLVACYAIGWRVTDKVLRRYPWLRMAQGAEDTGVIISFNTEAAEVSNSLLLPRGVRAKAINPLNWRTDGVRASALRNAGACFTDYNGSVVREIPYITGAYLDLERGALKVDAKITAEAYPPVLDIFTSGVFHLYDYQFFFRNLQSNVALRTAKHLALTAAE